MQVGVRVGQLHTDITGEVKIDALWTNGSLVGLSWWRNTWSLEVAVFMDIYKTDAKRTAARGVYNLYMMSFVGGAAVTCPRLLATVV